MTSYRLILVDDEESTRAGLSDFVRWSEVGFTLEGAFTDGRSAIAWMEHHPVDVVLTDIRMPDLSGIDLAEHIRRCWPATRVVLISGHREFDDARRAIEFGVKHYLLKPTRLDEVRATFRHLYTEIDAERAAASSTYGSSRRYQEALPYLRDQFFWDLVTGNLTHATDLRRRVALIDLAFDPQTTACAVATVEVTPDPFEALGDTHARSSALVRTIGDRIDQRRCFVTALWSRRYSVTALRGQETDHVTVMNDASEAVRMLVEALHASAECTTVCCPVEGYRSLVDLAVQGSPAAVRNTDSQPDEGGVESDRAMASDYRSLVQELHQGNIEQGLDRLDELIRGLDMSAGRPAARFVIGALAAADARITGTYGEDSALADDSALYREIASAENNRQLCSRVLPILKRLRSRHSDRSTLAARDTARAAADYIERHFTRELTLQDLADHVQLNAAYLSRLFHREIGVTFTEYLVDRRMRHAASLLLEESLSIGEIAHRSGYSDPKYFARVFRKQYGQTPKEFARRRWYGEHDR